MPSKGNNERFFDITDKKRWLMNNDKLTKSKINEIPIQRQHNNMTLKKSSKTKMTLPEFTTGEKWKWHAHEKNCQIKKMQKMNDDTQKNNLVI